MTSFPSNTLNAPRLAALFLHYNRLSSLPVFSAPSLTQLLLSNNPWRCDCSLVWLREGPFRKVIDNAYCQTPVSTVGSSIVSYKIPDTCSISDSENSTGREVFHSKGLVVYMTKNGIVVSTYYFNRVPYCNRIICFKTAVPLNDVLNLFANVAINGCKIRCL